jgi:hypothetical protein
LTTLKFCTVTLFVCMLALLVLPIIPSLCHILTLCVSVSDRTYMTLSCQSVASKVLLAAILPPRSSADSLLTATFITGARGGVVVKAVRYKPAGQVSIPDGVIGIFQWHNPSGHTMALGSTQPLTEMGKREPRNRPRRTHRVSGGIAQLFLNLDTRRGCVVSITPRLPLPPGKTRYPLYRRLGGPQGQSG